MRVIVTKHRIYELASDEQGVQVEQYFTGVTLPAPLPGSGRKSMTPQTARLLPCRAGALSVQHENRANQRNRNPDPPRHGPVPVIHEAGACAFSRPRNAHCEAWRPVIPCETIPHARSRQCARDRDD